MGKLEAGRPRRRLMCWFKRQGREKAGASGMEYEEEGMA